MGEEEFLLKWHDHHSSFFLLLEELVTREQLTDVTLSCGGTILNAHSLLLSVCSPYFRSLLSENLHREKHHIIHLNGVAGRHMQQLLVYMYRGEISICQEDLAPLIETARCLQIKGLAMATTSDVSGGGGGGPSAASSPPSNKKRSASQLTDYPVACSKPKEKKFLKSKSQGKCVLAPPSPSAEVNEIALLNSSMEEDDIRADDDYLSVSDYGATTDSVVFPGLKAGQGPNSSSSSSVALPLLPKPLSVLKTAETRTYLSKLIWLGNGGRRPQYGNPGTKPCWWPQHVLPWEEMKKMGGRKSQELSHINYTEILKQCLAAGYEYFGYDPCTYFSSEPQDHITEFGLNPAEEEGGGGEGGGGGVGGEYGDEDQHMMMLEDEAAEQPALEIDLDEIENQNPAAAAVGQTAGAAEKQLRNQASSSSSSQILCK